MSTHGLAAMALPARWARRDEFVILQAGFGRGERFLMAWGAWRADPERCRRLVYIALDARPEPPQGVHDQSDAAPIHQAAQLAAAWPVMTPGLHTLNFDEGPASGVTLLLGVGQVADLVPQLVARIDAFDLEDLASSPEAMHRDQPWLSRLDRLAAPGAMASLPPQAEHVRAALRQCGFVFTPEARFQPRHTPEPLAGGLWASTIAPDARHALIIGAGLAGCSAARALARQGWRCTVVDAHGTPAQGASGNPGGLFHSIVHGEDGIHARVHRAAALRTAMVVAPWLAAARFAGDVGGLLRLDGDTSDEAAQALLRHLGLPPEHVQWLRPEQAAQAAGIPVPCGGWLFRQGGWLSPAGYARALLDDARAHADVQFLGSRPVGRLARVQGPEGPQWQALDTRGLPIAQAAVVVLAGATHTAALTSMLEGLATLPLSSTRGQISSLPLDELVRAPRLPVAGAGYVLPAHEGRLLFGATSTPDDPEPSLREADHRHNVAQAAQLGSLPRATPGKAMDAWGDALPPGLQGRVGWRATTPDRLPYVGPLPLAPQAAAPGQRAPRGDQPRFVPRLRDAHGGVYVFTGLGSRGITWAALGGELLASWVTGSPSPIEASLRDALDPARVVTRARARGNQADASA